MRPAHGPGRLRRAGAVRRAAARLLTRRAVARRPSPDERFPAAEVEKAGYGAIWHGQKSWNGVAILAKGCAPEETRRGLPGDPADTHSRYIEAAINGVLIGCLYLPNGNPWPGPKFDYKLAWTARFETLAAELFKLDAPVVLAGD